MIVIIGLVILIAAVLIGVAGVFANSGPNHALTDNFAVFGYHVTGSTGVLFLYGIVVGGIGIAGLGLLLTGARRTARRGRVARRELKATRHDTSTQYGNTGTTDVAPNTSGTVTGQGTGNQTPARPRGMGKLFGRTSSAR
ncbi:hypothetical protein [Nocardia transvalensis]|uniref:hypothetical protein n=1 Tax=Nocardia transvalensis TaxID=37333 RepID=UPI0018962AB7|nr:hypothetical protein [Nocardia transvalensis]MBF6332206.1 hypothetical protein [Nocardia transvalensis]